MGSHHRQSRLNQFLAVSLTASIIFTTARSASAVSPEPFFQRYSPPSSIGTVVDAFQGSDPRTLVLVQDLHINYDAQHNIQNLLAYYSDKNLLPPFVAVEGASGPVDSSSLSGLPDARIRSEVADFFMRQGELPGPGAYSVATGKSYLLYGVEDSKYYEANLLLFRTSIEARRTLSTQLARLQAPLQYLKRSAYSSAMRRQDRTASAFWQSRVSEEDYQASLAALRQLAATPLQRNIVEADRVLHLVQQLATQQIVETEVRELTSQWGQTLATLRMVLGASSEELSSISEAVKASVEFYVLAAARETPMLENTLARMAATPSTTGLLVAGGFHSKGITEALKARNISFVVIAPEVKHLDTGYESVYEARLLDQHLSVKDVLNRFSNERASGSGTALSTGWKIFAPSMAQVRAAAIRMAQQRRQHTPKTLASESRSAVKSLGEWTLRVLAAGGLLSLAAHGSHDALFAGLSGSLLVLSPEPEDSLRAISAQLSSFLKSPEGGSLSPESAEKAAQQMAATVLASIASATETHSPNAISDTYQSRNWKRLVALLNPERASKRTQRVESPGEVRATAVRELFAYYMRPGGLPRRTELESDERANEQGDRIESLLSDSHASTDHQAVVRRLVSENRWADLDAHLGDPVLFGSKRTAAREAALQRVADRQTRRAAATGLFAHFTRLGALPKRSEVEANERAYEQGERIGFLLSDANAPKEVKEVVRRIVSEKRWADLDSYLGEPFLFGSKRVAAREAAQQRIARGERFGRGSAMPTHRTYLWLEKRFPQASERTLEWLAAIAAPFSLYEKGMMLLASNERIADEEPWGAESVTYYWVTRILSLAGGFAGFAFLNMHDYPLPLQVVGGLSSLILSNIVFHLTINLLTLRVSGETALNAPPLLGSLFRRANRREADSRRDTVRFYNYERDGDLAAPSFDHMRTMFIDVLEDSLQGAEPLIHFFGARDAYDELKLLLKGSEFRVQWQDTPIAGELFASSDPKAVIPVIISLATEDPSAPEKLRTDSRDQVSAAQRYYAATQKQGLRPVHLYLLDKPSHTSLQTLSRAAWSASRAYETAIRDTPSGSRTRLAALVEDFHSRFTAPQMLPNGPAATGIDSDGLSPEEALEMAAMEAFFITLDRETIAKEFRARLHKPDERDFPRFIMDLYTEREIQSAIIDRQMKELRRIMAYPGRERLVSIMRSLLAEKKWTDFAEFVHSAAATLPAPAPAVRKEEVKKVGFKIETTTEVEMIEQMIRQRSQMLLFYVENALRPFYEADQDPTLHRKPARQAEALADHEDRLRRVMRFLLVGSTPAQRRPIIEWLMKKEISSPDDDSIESKSPWHQPTPIERRHQLAEGRKVLEITGEFPASPLTGATLHNSLGGIGLMGGVANEQSMVFAFFVGAALSIATPQFYAQTFSFAALSLRQLVKQAADSIRARLAERQKVREAATQLAAKLAGRADQNLDSVPSRSSSFFETLARTLGVGVEDPVLQASARRMNARFLYSA